jgi:hypothetical protein
MPDQSPPPLSVIASKVTAAKSIAIILPQNHTADNLAAGLALFLGLKQNLDQSIKLNIVSSTEVKVAFQRLYGINKISSSLGSKNLVVTLGTDYENIEKVSYDNDGGKFNLVIETKEGVERLGQENISFSYRGVDADLLIAVGFTTPEDAGNLLMAEPKLFADREVILISGQRGAIGFGIINYVDPAVSGNCEMITKLLRYLKINLDADTATNLIAGMESATNNFQSNATAETFAAISWCMRAGGRRYHLSSQGFESRPSMQPQFNQSPFGFPRSQPMPVRQENEDQQPQPMSEEEGDQSPKQDWLKPKIFKTDNHS